jgi:hypothetical protein
VRESTDASNAAQATRALAPIVTIPGVGEDLPKVRLTPEAVHELRPEEALVFDWVRVAMCCGAAGEICLRRTTVHEVLRAGTFVALSRDAALPVFAHRRAFGMLTGQEILVDCRKFMGMRRFTHDLPPDFGLRGVFGRLPATPEKEEPWPQPPAEPAR